MSFTPFQQLLYQLLIDNELSGGSPYKIYPPAKPGSTWAFGTPQFDTGNNAAAASLLADILINAKDSNGNYIIDPTNTSTRGSADNVTDPQVAVLLDEAESSDPTSLSSDDQALINASLSSSYGMQAIDSGTLDQLNSLGDFASLLAQSACQQAQSIANSTIGQLFFCDFANQYGTKNQNALLGFIHTGSYNGVTYSGAMGVDALLQFYFQTSFNKSNPWVGMYRFANVVTVAGGYTPSSPTEAMGVLAAYSSAYLGAGSSGFVTPAEQTDLQKFISAVLEPCQALVEPELTAQYGIAIDPAEGGLYVGYLNGASGFANNSNNGGIDLDANFDNRDDVLIGGVGDYVIRAGNGNDVLIAGNGNQGLEAGSGADTLIGGQGPSSEGGSAGNDTLVGGVGFDTFAFAVPTGATTVTETILDTAANGDVEVISNGQVISLGGSAEAPLSPVQGVTDEWQDSLGTIYTFVPGKDQLTITGGPLGQGNQIVVDDFNVEQAASASAAGGNPNGYMGFHFRNAVSVTAGATAIGDPPAPNFLAGSTQSYTISVDVPSDTAQTITVSLTGAPAADFGVVGAGGTVNSLNSDGTFSVTIPAGETSVAFSLVNTGDVGGAATLQLVASFSGADGANGGAVSSTPLEQNYVVPELDPFSTPQQQTQLYSPFAPGTSNSVTQNGITESYYTDASGGDPVAMSSGNNFIDVRLGNESIDGSAGNDSFITQFGTTWANAGMPSGGVNVINLHGGQDVVWNADTGISGSYAVEIYANEQTDLATAVSQANSGSGTDKAGDFIGSGANEFTIVGGTGNDLISTIYDGVVVAGTGNDTIMGGVNLYTNEGVDSAGYNPDPQTVQNFSWSASYDSGELALGGDLAWGFNGANFSDSGSPTSGYEGNIDGVGEPFAAANETVFGGAGNDVILLPNGADEVVLGTGHATVLGGMGGDTVFGASGDASVQGGGGNDYITGGSGNDVLVGRGGDNTIIGGSGNDTIFAGSQGTSTDPQSWASSETGSNYVDGGSGNSAIFGSGGADTLIAGTGNSTVYGGAGTESIVGGSGDDLLVGGSGSDTLDAGGAGNDSLLAVGSDSTTSYLYGGDGTDLIQSGYGTNVIYAGDGGTEGNPTEVLAGADGSDDSTTVTIYGGTGIDYLRGGDSGTTVIYAGDGGTSVAPTSIVAGAGATTVYGGLGIDIISGGSGNDVLYAGDGGEPGSPTYVIAGTGSQTLYGGAGDDVLRDLQGGGDLLVGGSGNESLFGSGNDTLVAGTGDDYLNDAGTGTIVLDNGFGNDEIAGGAAVQFGSGITAADLSVTAGLTTSGTGALEIDAGGGSVLVDGGLTGALSGVTFAGGSSLGLQQLIQQDGTDQTIQTVSGTTLFSVDDGASVSADPTDNVISAWGNTDTITGSSLEHTGVTVYAGGDGDQVTGGSGADTLTAGGTNDTVIAGGSGSVLTASGSSALLQAGAGGDTLIAGGSGDTLVGGSGNDEFVVNDASAVIDAAPGSGSDSVLASVDYTLPQNVDSLTLTGSSNLTATGNDDASNTITGNSGNDTLIAGTGQDTLIAGSGIDTLIGGGGNDTYIVNNAADVVQESNFSTHDTIVSSVSYTLSQNVDSLTLSGSSDLTGTGNDDQSNLITGNAGNDTLVAGSGEDTLIAGSGVDTLIGGGGNDTFVVNNSSDVVQESSGFSNDTVDSSVSYTLPTNVDTLILKGASDVTAQGNDDAANIISGNSGNDELIAGSGADTLEAGSGIDTLIAGTGNDLLVGVSGDTYVIGADFGNTEIDQTTGTGTVRFGAGVTASSLTLGAILDSQGTPSLTVSDGQGGVLTIDGALGGSIKGFDFADGSQFSLPQLLAQSGISPTTLVGAQGDLVLNSATAASIVGGSGADTVYGLGANDTIVAGGGNQALYGLGADDVIVGGVGLDSLYGGTGDDTLVGGTASTVMYGGTGNDTYVLEQGAQAEIHPSSGNGSEEIYLPAGMTFGDFSSYISGNDLVLQSQDGATSALIKDYFTSEKTWFIASDSDPPELLSNFINGSSQSITGYNAEVSSLRQSYTANLASELATLGDEGGSLGTLLDIRNSPYETVSSYTFGGVTSENIAVTGGTLPLGSSESGQDSVVSQTQTYTVSQPVYSTETIQGAIYDLSLSQFNTNLSSGGGNTALPPGATATPIFNGPPDPLTGQPTLSGYQIAMPNSTRLVQTGTTTQTYTITSGSDVLSRNFTAYNVTGDGGNDSITSSSPFAGTVVTGDGNVYVNLGTTSANGQGDWISGDYPGTSMPLFPSGSSQYAVQPGAFIQAGAGNDTLIGTNGNDVIAAGSGFDSMDGGNGSDTYIVPMQGFATDVITDSGDPAPALPQLLTGGTQTDLGGSSFDPNNPEKIFETPGPGQLPIDTLELPAGITPQNLKYRLFTSPDYPGKEVLQLNSGTSNVLIVFEPPPVYTDLRIFYEELLFNPITTASRLGVDEVKFADGTVMTLGELMQSATALPSTFDPTVTGQSTNVGSGQAIAASLLFRASDTAGNSLTWYQISNTGTGGGYFALNGQAEPTGQSFMVNAAQLGQLQYVGGAAGTSDSIQVSAFDGAVWSALATSTVNATTGNVFAATGADQLVTGSANGPDTLIGGYSGDTLVGASGQDTFEYAPGGGPEVISESASSSTSEVQFGNGISPASITLGATGDPELVLTIGTGGDSVSIAGFDPRNPLASTGIQKFAFADGTTLSLLQLLGDSSIEGSSGVISNPDGSSTYYGFTPSGNTIYSAQVVDAAGQVTTGFSLNRDGSASDSTYAYHADGSYSDTVVATQAGGGASTTTVYGYNSAGQLTTENVTNADGSTDDYGYNAQGQLTSADITNADGSTSDSTYAYHADGSYSDTVVATPAGGGASTTTVYGYNSSGQLTTENVTNPDGSTDDYGYNPQGQLTSADITNADGSTSDSTYAYHADGSYSDTVVTTPAGGGASTTTVYGYNSAGQLTTEDVTKPDGSKDDYAYNPQGQLTSADITNADGSTSDSTYAYNADGSHSDTVVTTPAGGGGSTTTAYGYNSAGQLTTEDVTNPDGSKDDYSYNAHGQLTSADVTNADGSTNDSTYAYSADGYSDTVVTTPAGGGASTTTVYGYNTTGQLTTENVTNPDGSTDVYSYNAQGQLTDADVTNANGSMSDSTYAYNADGSYSDTVVTTPAGGGGSTTIVYGYNNAGQLTTEDVTNPDGSTDDYSYNAQGQLTSADITNADGSTSDSTYTCNADRSYSDTVLATPAGGGSSTTTVYDYDSQGNFVGDNTYSPGSGGSYTDTWWKQDGSHGTYWWNSSTLEYQDDWYNSDGTSFTDDYQYAAGGSPASSGYSFTEAYSASDGSHGTRQFDASSGTIQVNWYSSTAGTVNGTVSDAGFIGPQSENELTDPKLDASFFNPAVSPSFSAFLAGH